MSSFKELKEEIKQLRKENKDLDESYATMRERYIAEAQERNRMKDELENIKHNSASPAWIIASCVLCATNVALLILFIIYALNH